MSAGSCYHWSAAVFFHMEDLEILESLFGHAFKSIARLTPKTPKRPFVHGGLKRHPISPHDHTVCNEQSRARLQEEITRFKSDDAAEFSFPPTLTSEERKFAHFYAASLGLVSESSGVEPNRILTVSKSAIRFDATISLDLTANQSVLMSDYMIAHPPSQLELEHVDAPEFVESEPFIEQTHWRPYEPKLFPPIMPRNINPSLREFRQQLPAWRHKTEICDAIKQNQVILISGQTGSGKSTQVPQFIVDDPDMGPRARIYITQPRRLAAMAICTRVAQERAVEIGKLVGYSVRYNRSCCSDTQMLFLTPGNLIRRLSGNNTLRGVTHVIIDEAHERSLDTDYLLMMLHDLVIVKQLRPDLKVIVMSANLELEKLTAYFNNCPVVSIESAAHAVDVFYLDHVLSNVGWAGGSNGQGTSQQLDAIRSYKRSQSVIATVEEQKSDGDAPAGPAADEMIDLYYQHISTYSTDCDLICRLLTHLMTDFDLVEQDGKKGSIVVFLSGWEDIIILNSLLDQSPLFADETKFKIFQLHSAIEYAMLMQVFEPVPEGVRKIILATNIAEVSITVDNATIIIDTGFCKSLEYDQERQLRSLRTGWISKASANQRRGRTGRTCPGLCFRLYSKKTMLDMAESNCPELLRLPLDSLCLLTQYLGLSKISNLNVEGQSISYSRMPLKDFFGKAMDPPSDKSIADAIFRLRGLKLMDLNENLTKLGSVCSWFPFDPRTTLFMLWASAFGIGDAAVGVGVAMECQDPFLLETARSRAERCEVADNFSKKYLSGESNSDIVAVYNAMTTYQANCKLFKAKDKPEVLRNISRQLGVVSSVADHYVMMFEHAKEQFAAKYMGSTGVFRSFIVRICK